MGAYVNPENGTKEEWLKKEGKEYFLETIDYDDLLKNTLPVILADNGLFTAAGIVFSKKEWERFNNPQDDRFKRFFLVNIKKLHTVSPELKGYMEEN